MRINWELLEKTNYKPNNIKGLLSNLGSLLNSAKKGDSVSHSIYVDIKTAINADGVLSPKQKEYLLLWMDGYTMHEIGAIYQRSQQSVSKIITKAARNISKFLTPDENYFQKGVVKSAPTMVIYEGQNMPTKKHRHLVTDETPLGKVEFDNKQYNLSEVKQYCSRCGSSNIEFSVYHNHAVTNKLMRVWKCWNCEISYDVVQGLGTREGLFNE